jgi:hypothetical protein
MEEVRKEGEGSKRVHAGRGVTQDVKALVLLEHGGRLTYLTDHMPFDALMT